MHHHVIDVLGAARIRPNRVTEDNILRSCFGLKLTGRLRVQAEALIDGAAPTSNRLGGIEC